jgi:hypothetical protein
VRYNKLQQASQKEMPFLFPELDSKKPIIRIEGGLKSGQRRGGSTQAIRPKTPEKLRF